MDMRVSADGRKLIERFEGKRLVAYKDCVGVLTIGFGHTNAAGGYKFRVGDSISEGQADAILGDDLGRFCAKIAKGFKREPTQPQFDAFASLAFNIGPGAFLRSTALARFNQGDDAGAGAAFILYDKAGKPSRTIPGLLARRRAEKALFDHGAHAAAHGLLDAANYDSIRDADDAQDENGEDVSGMPKGNGPEAIKPIWQSKVAWLSAGKGGLGIAGVTGYLNGITGQAKDVKDASSSAVDLVGLGPQFVMWGIVAIIVASAAFTIWDRHSKLTKGQV